MDKRPKGNATWFPDGSFVIGGNFIGKDSEFDDLGFIEISLLKSDVPCIEGSTCLADCGSDQVWLFLVKLLVKLILVTIKQFETIL